MAVAEQATRAISISTVFGTDTVKLRSFNGREALSELFAYEVELLSERDDLEVEDIVGTNATLRVDSEEGSRYFNGLVSNFQYAGWGEQFTTYRATLVPWLWKLQHRTDSRIFQKKTAPQIVSSVFDSLGISDYSLELSGDYERRGYCVQYRETDFNFVSRLMEEEGIFYFFRHENGRHELVLSDSPAAFKPLPESEMVFPQPNQEVGQLSQIKSWESIAEFRPGRVAHRDFNFKAPRANLLADAPVKTVGRAIDALEIYDYPGRYDQHAVGGSLANVRAEELEARQRTVNASSTYRNVTPGGKFGIAAHRSPSEVGKSYAVTAVETRASVGATYTPSDDDGGFEFENRFTCIPAATCYRPERKATKPIVEGPQTAVVVGPPGEEIYTDKYGRVKCHFHWDRLGKRNEKSSCWVRVSQTHAGNGWGSISIPRIGEEVIVGFLEGDPDQPIIKGRTFNAEKAAPFGLPAGKTRSGLKSNTHKGSGYNEITMDDTAGAEQIRVNAQYDMDTTVGNNQTLSVGVDRSAQIGANDSLTVAVDKSEEVAVDSSTTTADDETVTVGQNIEIDAGVAITFACGESTIHMNQAGVITISGQFVTSAAAGLNTIIAPLTEVTGAKVLNQAGMVVLNLGGACHLKGKSAKVVGLSTNVKGGSNVVVKGAPIEIGGADAPKAELPECEIPKGEDAAAEAEDAAGVGGSGADGGGQGEGGEQRGNESEATQPPPSDERKTENRDESEKSESDKNDVPSEKETDLLPPDKAAKGAAKGTEKAGKESAKWEKDIQGKEGDVARADKANQQAQAEQAAAQNDFNEAEAKRSQAEADSRSKAHGAQSSAENLEAQKAAKDLSDAEVKANQADGNLQSANNRASQAADELSDATKALDDVPHNTSINRSTGKVLSKGGKVLGPAGVAYDAYSKGSEAADAYSKGDTRGVASAGGGFVGGFAGGAYGAAKGAGAGMLVCGPPCALVGGVIGGVGGGLLGEYGGRVVAETGHDVVARGGDPS